MESQAGAGRGTRMPDGAGDPPAAGTETPQLVTALLIAGRRLAEAMQAENAALAALDLPVAAGLADGKVRATGAFAAAQSAALKTGGVLAGPARQEVARLAEALSALGEENQRLLRRAVALQSRVIEVIAGAALPRAAAGLTGSRYGHTGAHAVPSQAPAIAVRTRA
jgi:hypothetical protein